MEMKMSKYRVAYNREAIANINQTVIQEMDESGIQIYPGMKIAIAVGSRGINNLAEIVRSVVSYLKAKGAEPFIVPAMGSHGGANAKGQIEVLEGYQVTESYTGAPIKSSMAVVELPNDGLATKVYMDKYAYEADGTIIINRIKAHTDFHDKFESGLVKMCVIGLGKHKQALAIHHFRLKGLREMIAPAAEKVIEHGNILLGIGIVENAYDQTKIIKAIKPKDFFTEEPKLLKISKESMPKLPVDDLDILIIDEMGKDISGVGLDTNIIGRMKVGDRNEPEYPRITNIVITDLTEASHGNALGLGLGDIITQRLFDKINLKAMYANVITSTFLDRGKIPVIAKDDREALDYAIITCGAVKKENLKVIRIKNTLKLGEFYATKAVGKLLKDNPDITLVEEESDAFNGRVLKEF